MPDEAIEAAWVILNCARALAGYLALSMIADLQLHPSRLSNCALMARPSQKLKV
jgi:hypothetical protein